MQKKQYFLNKFNNCKHNIRKTWQIINELTGHKKPSNLIKKLIDNSGTIIDNDQDVANAFNDHFCSIANNLEENLPHNNLAPTSFINSNISNLFSLSPITEEECEILIAKLKPTKTNLNHIG